MVNDEPRSFADRLTWLRDTVARDPGTGSRFSTDDILTALTAVQAGAPTEDPEQEARLWWRDARESLAAPTDTRSRRFLAALERLFRLPAGYFQDDGISRATDARIEFTSDLAARGVRFIGPCRALASEIDADELHELHLEIVAALERRPPTL